MNIDVGSLSIYETSPSDIFRGNCYEKIQNVSERCYNSLIAELEKISNEREQINSTRKLEYQIKDFNINPNLVLLSSATTILPRFHKPPKKPLMTRWEQFAKSKGIKKKKRSRLVYSEQVKDWVPRYGKNSKAQLEEELDIIHEEKVGGSSDPFKEKKENKKLEKNKHELKELHNRVRSKKNKEKDQQKSSLDKSIKNTNYATASLGKFSQKGDKAQKHRKLAETKKKDMSREEERTRNSEILQKIIKK